MVNKEKVISWVSSQLITFLYFPSHSHQLTSDASLQHLSKALLISFTRIVNKIQIDTLEYITTYSNII